MAESWTGSGLLWCNPPFSKFSAVVDKIARDKARCILVMPDGPFKEYWQRVQALRVAETFYPPGTQVFELDGEPVPGTKWGTWAYLLDGSLASRSARVAGMGAGVVAERPMEGEDVQRLRDALHKQFDGKVLREEIRPNPRCGEARKLAMPEWICGRVLWQRSSGQSTLPVSAGTQ